MNSGSVPLSVSISGRVRVILGMVKDQSLKGKVLVDVGSSFGWLENEVQDLGLKRTIGIEPDDKVREQAEKTVKKSVFLKGNASSIPLKSSSADVVTLFDVIEHVPKGTEVSVLLEVKRILKKGGILLLSTPYSSRVNFLDPAWFFGHRHYSPDKVKEMLAQSGFKIIKMEVRGKVWAYLYLIWLYINKWLLGGNFPQSKWLEEKYDKDYRGAGFHTIFLKSTLP